MATSCCKFCSMCDQIHLTVKAIEYCPECEEFLCVDCKKNHSLSKLSKSHTTIYLQQYQELPTFVQSATGICRDHDKCFEMYCAEHHSPCCVRCLSAHRDCKGVTPISDVFKNVKVSSSVSDLEQTIKDLIDYTKRITDKLSQDKATTLSQKENIIEEIKKVRTAINNHLDFLEKNILDSLSKTVDESINRIGNLMSEISAAEKRLHDISADIIRTKQYASDFQVFITLKEIESSVSIEEHFLWSLNENKRLDYIDIRVKTEDMLKHVSAMKTFADIEEHTVPWDVTLVKKKHKQAQIGTTGSRTVHDISLALLEAIKIQTNESIKGLTMLPSGRTYLISEYNDYQHSDRVFIKPVNGIDYTLQCLSKNDYDINDMVAITSTSFVATSNHRKQLCIVDNITDATLPLKINVSDCTSGITICGITLIYCVKGKGIESYHLVSKNVNVILKNEQISSDSYIAYSNNNLFFTYANVVACCCMTGTVLWKFDNKPTLNGPRGIAVDKDGFVYVTGESSENVVVISLSGTESRQLLGKDNGLKRPRAIKYDAEKHRLMVCNEREHLFVFDIK